MAPTHSAPHGCTMPFNVWEGKFDPKHYNISPPALLIPHIDALLGIESDPIEVGHLGDGEGERGKKEGEGGRDAMKERRKRTTNTMRLTT